MKQKISDFVILVVVLTILILSWVSWINVAAKVAIARDDFIMEMTNDLSPENKCLMLCLDKYYDLKEKRETCSKICLTDFKGEVKNEVFSCKLV